MKTKGQKIINAIGKENKRPYNFGDIMQASHAARQAGTFTANDVADLLRWAYMVAIDAGGKRNAIENMRREYEHSVDEIREKALEDITEANRRADDEYQRARDEMEDELRRYKDRADEFEEDAEYYRELEKNTPPAIWDAIICKDWNEAMSQDVERIAEDVETCGRAWNFCGRLAI